MGFETAPAQVESTLAPLPGFGISTFASIVAIAQRFPLGGHLVGIIWKRKWLRLVPILVLKLVLGFVGILALAFGRLPVP